MNNIKFNEKLIMSIAIIIGSLVLGGFYYLAQVNKQKSIENQKIAEIEAEKELLSKEEEKESKNALLYNLCVGKAEKNYWSYLESNGTKKEDGTITALTRHWETADERKTQDIENCFKQYKK